MYRGGGFGDQSVRPQTAGIAFGYKHNGHVKQQAIEAPASTLQESTHVFIPSVGPTSTSECQPPVQTTKQTENKRPQSAAISKLMDDMDTTIKDYAGALGREIPQPLRPVSRIGQFRKRPGTAPTTSSSSSSRHHALTTTTFVENNYTSSNNNNHNIHQSNMMNLDLVPSLRKPLWDPIPPSSTTSTTRPSLRPPLTQQLASIVAGAEDAKRSLDMLEHRLEIRHRNRGNNNQNDLIFQPSSQQQQQQQGEKPLVSLPALGCTVGGLRCSQGTVVHLYHDRMEYVFSHPYSRGTVIDMVMYYAHLQEVSTGGGGGGGGSGKKQQKTSITWRIPHELQMFGRDYDHTSRTGANGRLSIDFLAASAAAKAVEMINGRSLK